MRGQDSAKLVPNNKRSDEPFSVRADQVRRRPGPIPASAGEPRPLAHNGFIVGAYPRQRGGTLVGNDDVSLFPGLSPPARGNQDALDRIARRLGPIPASAGEPRPEVLPPAHHSAYPRQRGGTLDAFAYCLATAGLSPPARGNLDRTLVDALVTGPIPASAGEPDIANQT